MIFSTELEYELIRVFAVLGGRRVLYILSNISTRIRTIQKFSICVICWKFSLEGHWKDSSRETPIRILFTARLEGVAWVVCSYSFCERVFHVFGKISEVVTCVFVFLNTLSGNWRLSKESLISFPSFSSFRAKLNCGWLAEWWS